MTLPTQSTLPPRLGSLKGDAPLLALDGLNREIGNACAESVQD